MNLLELITDPSSQQLSMSRLCLPLTLGLDAFWVAAVIMGWPPIYAVSPVSGMLSAITGIVAGIYGLSTVKSTGVFNTIRDAIGQIKERKPI